MSGKLIAVEAAIVSNFVSDLEKFGSCSKCVIYNSRIVVIDLRFHCYMTGLTCV